MAVSGVVSRTAVGQAQPDIPEIRTAATVSRTVRPDLATLMLRFSADGRTPLEAGLRLAARSDSLRRALAAIGVPRDSVVSGSRWYWWQGRVQVLISQRCEFRADARGCTPVVDTVYRAFETLTARIRQLDQLGAVVDSALALRIIDVQGPQFSAVDTHEAQEECLREASTRARSQAAAIADAAGVRLGRILSLGTSSEGRGYSGGYELSAITVTASGGDGGGTAFVAPSVTVSVTVYGRWAIVERAR
jgi:uncharacterized protein YggE